MPCRKYELWSCCINAFGILASIPHNQDSCIPTCTRSQLMINSLRALLILLLILALAIPPWQPTATEQAKPELAKLEKLAVEHLPNAIRIHPRVISGGLPEGDAAFAELRALGVRTVISVDGMSPDVATAKKYGLRYVHLPHGYDGIPPERIADLTAAVQSLPGPIYIHCHHGKHRSPAASAAACVGAGLIEPADSLAVLKLAGTSPQYTGLFHDVAATRRLPPLHKTAISFPEQSPVPQLVARMVQIEHWQAALVAALQSPPTTPVDSSHRENPAAVALLLREQFTELLRDDSNQQRPAEFVQLLQESETAAQRLEAYLASDNADLRVDSQREQAGKLLMEVSTRCATCHKTYRDSAGSK